jgi:hypothetical protein
MKLKYFSLIAIVVCVLTSCSEKMNYKEFKIDDAEYMKVKFERAGGFITTMYSKLDYDFGNYSGAMLSSATDESVYSQSGNSIESFFNGAWSPANANGSLWTTCYEGISYANMFLDEFNGLTFDDYKLDVAYAEEMHQYNNFQYEARFLRAYFYFLLVRQYGGVPLKVSDLEASEANNLPRATADEIFQFIDDECVAIKDKIIEDYADLGKMALSITETGRANNLAVLALRARAALYHASPLFNPNNDQTLWKKAAQANMDVISACRARQFTLSSDYAGLFKGRTNWSDAKALKEIIFARRLLSESRTFETYNFPVGMSGAGAGGQGGNCPTQNLVEAYETGDIRLAATVARNGDSWPNANTQPLETYIGGTNGLPNVNATPTSYYLKKYVDPETQISGNGANTSKHVWVSFRLAEFYLNYAEAYLNLSDKSGLSTTAASAINTVRKRAGLADLSDSEATLEACKKERFVELAFEGHRFFDVRRWKEGDKYFKTIYGLEITKNADGTFTETKKVVQNRQWDESKMNLFPIPQSEILKAGNLQQNPGW